MNSKTLFKMLLGRCAMRISRLPAVAAALALLALLPHQAGAQTTFNYTGAMQAYTVPAGAGGVLIQANGAGGGSGGNDLNGLGGQGGAGARAMGTYYAAPGTVLNIYVGQGGRDAKTSQSPYSCSTGGGLSAIGVGGLAGGPAGFAGGSGGDPGCNGYSGGGGGGGAASVVATAANARLVVAGGGGGGQGGAWDVPGRAGLSATATGALPGSAGLAGTSRVGDGAGGGGGGGGCPGGAGGANLADQSGANNTAQSAGGSSCSGASVVNFAVTGAAGSAGGASVAGVPTNGNPGGNGSVTITPIYPTLNLAKSQPSPALAVGSNSTYTLTVTNTSTTPGSAAQVLDQLPAQLSYVSGSGAGWSCSAAANASGTLVTCNFSGTIAASGGTAALQITVATTNNLSVTNYASVDSTGGTAPATPTTCTAANTPIAGCAAPVTSAAATQISGTVYADANHNGNLDAGEGGLGLSGLFVKLASSSGGVCTGPAIAAAPVASGSGAYSFSGVAQGNYCLVLDNNATLSDISPAIPAGLIATQNPSLVVRLAVGGAPPAPQNFGLYNGATLTGTVFADTGAPTGTANNGVKDGTEAGLGGVTVGTGSAAVSGTVSAGDGSYTLWIPASATGALTVTAQPGSTYLATGGTLGTTGGTYTRPSLVFTPVAGQSYTAANFGLVTRNTLAPNNAETAPPGTTVNYAHMFVADSGGSVTFLLSGTATPASTAWSEIIYRDSNCNAVLESTESAVTGPIAVTAGQTVCLIVKEFVPAGAATGAVNTVTLTAAFTYTGANPALSATLTAVDVTTVGQPGALALGKLVNNVTQGGAAATAVNAKPGDTLQYTLTATNNGSQPLSTLQINDATPAFTTFLSASCPAVLPSGITACATSTQPAVGAQGGIQWTLTGVLAPAAQIVVTYQAKVDQ
ncbi:MAG: SdrD B-like domain-containing protein [Polaromonas sp.]